MLHCDHMRLVEPTFTRHVGKEPLMCNQDEGTRRTSPSSFSQKQRGGGHTSPCKHSRAVFLAALDTILQMEVQVLKKSSRVHHRHALREKKHQRAFFERCAARRRPTVSVHQHASVSQRLPNNANRMSLRGYLGFGRLGFHRLASKQPCCMANVKNQGKSRKPSLAAAAAGQNEMLGKRGPRH